MPEIRIKIDQMTYDKLKEMSKDDERSLTKYLERGLKYLSNIQNGYHNTPIDNLSSSQSQAIPTENNGRQVKKTIVEYEKPATVLTPEEQELADLKLKHQKDKLRADRINYFNKKYKEVYGEKPPEAFRASTIDYILNKCPDNPSLDAYIDTLENLSYSDLSNPRYEFYTYQTDIEDYHAQVKYPTAPVYLQIRDYFLQNEAFYELKDIYEYPSADYIKYNYDNEIAEALTTLKEGIDWEEVADYFKI